MINVFRALRSGFLDKGQLRKYLLYALGEITLVIIGILVAIQVDNWNNRRKETNQLHANLDQIYTVFDRDLDRLISLRSGYQEQLQMIDTIRLRPKAIKREVLPFMLYYVDLAYESLSTEASNLAQKLNLDPEDLRQRNLAKAISEYERNFQVTTYFNEKYVTALLEQQQLSQPSLIFHLSEQDNFREVDLNFFDDDEIATAWKMLESPLMQRALRSARNEKERNIKILSFNIDIIKAKKAAIAEYYPDVVLLYRNIGITGDGTELNSWDQDVDLQPRDKSHTIWEADVKLRGGLVKFREGDDWTLNWGGTVFPEGNAVFYGSNIPVKAGRYHVVFDLNERVYSFKEIAQGQ
ncbi:MAG: hypothetical protein U0V64_14910 [Cyclobacteriaceae bacterium]